MIELGTRPVVVMQAAPFCFGPVSTSLAIAAELRKFDVAIVWLAEGTALELLKAGQSSYDDYVIPFNTGCQADRERCAHFVEEADVVIVNTDPDFAEFALSLNRNTVYLDILHWMWHDLPKVVERCALYIYEDFVRSDDQIRRLGPPPNSLRVGPLIEPIGDSEETVPPGRHLLVSLGGLHRPGFRAGELLSRFSDMAYAAVLDALNHTDQFDEVFFAGGGITPSDAIIRGGAQVHSGCLSKGEYWRLLRTAKAAVLSPGLTGFYEAAAAHTPVFFLPPHNYSQHLQLQSYKSVLPPTSYSDWQRLGLPYEMPCFLPEDQMLDQVDEVLGRVVAMGDLLAEHLRQFLTGAFEVHDPLPAARMVDLLRASDGVGGAPRRVASEIVRRIEARIDAQVMPSKRPSFSEVPLPKKVTLELFGGCQLRCPLCPTGNRLRPGRAKGSLKLATVEALLKEIGSHVEVMELFNWGEPFLNPDACEIIRMIADRGIRTVVSSNLQRIPEPQEIIDSGLSELIVSCHGMTQETYQKYMVGGDLALTLKNLDRILLAGGPDMKMRVVVRYVVFAHNEHELPLAIARFKGMPVIVEAAPMRIDMRDEILGNKAHNLTIYGEWVPESSRFYDKSALRAVRAPAGCNLPFEEAVIDVDGSVSPCCSCFDPGHNVGNFLKDGFATVWNGDNYNEARRVVTGRGETGNERVVCRTCKNNGYRDF